jgi:hypothetical protein
MESKKICPFGPSVVQFLTTGYDTGTSPRSCNSPGARGELLVRWGRRLCLD